MRNLGPPKCQLGEDRELDSACEARLLPARYKTHLQTLYQLILTSTLRGSFILPILQWQTGRLWKGKPWAFSPPSTTETLPWRKATSSPPEHPSNWAHIVGPNQDVLLWGYLASQSGKDMDPKARYGAGISLALLLTQAGHWAHSHAVPISQTPYSPTQSQSCQKPFRSLRLCMFRKIIFRIPGPLHRTGEKITTTSLAFSSSPKELLNLIWKQLGDSSLTGNQTNKKKGTECTRES